MTAKQIDPIVIDTFPAFLQFWNRVRGRSLSEQIDGWANEYLASWPELLAKQVDDYSSQQIDWREIARERIFPYIDQRLSEMEHAHTDLPGLCRSVFAKAQQLLSIGEPITFVIHVGIGCGAGWAASYGGAPAVLLGLEGIAENGWCEAGSLRGLLAHEIGHIFFRLERNRGGERPLGENGWSQLYDEGFAQYCEGIMIDQGTFHEQAGDQDEDWLVWCQAHSSWLAAEFLRAIETEQPVSRFFGSWFEVEGHSQTGYFLGYEVIKRLAQAGNSLGELARLEPEKASKPILKEMALRP